MEDQSISYSSIFEKFFEEKIHCDTTLFCKDGDIRCHKIGLAKATKDFKKVTENFAIPVFYYDLSKFYKDDVNMFLKIIYSKKKSENLSNLNIYK